MVDGNTKRRILEGKIKCLEKRIKITNDFCRYNMVLCSTTNEIVNFTIVESKDLIFSEVVIPNGLLGAFTTGTFFTIDALDEARTRAINGLKDKARLADANGVIGVDIDICDLSNHGMMVSANGTAVYIVPENDLDELMDEKKSLEAELSNLVDFINSKKFDISGISGETTSDELYTLYAHSKDKKIIILSILQLNEEGLSVNQLREKMDNKVDLMELATYLKKLEEEKKIKQDLETKKYSIV